MALTIDTILSHGEMVEIAEIAINDSKHVVEIRKYGRALCEKYHCSKLDQTRFATALSEVARNVINYAHFGECTFTVMQYKNNVFLFAMVKDKGAGIPDIDIALKDGYTSTNGLGLGLPGARRLVNLFDIESSRNGTKVTLVMSCGALKE